MVDDTENPREALHEQFRHVSDVKRKRSESKESAQHIRFTRVANGLDRMLARLLEAK
jgi:hypothetical protein